MDHNNQYRISEIIHKERINKNPDRLQYAIQQLEKNNIKYEVKNEETCHIHTWRKSDDQLIQYWAGTGKILDYEQRGIDNLIDLIINS